MITKDKQLAFILVLLFIFGFGIFYWYLTTRGIDVSNYQLIKPKERIVVTYPNKVKLSSLAFANETEIPQKYTCSGDNINPPLTISDVPDDTKSLVLVIEDPDAPFKTWTHWILYNIDPQTTEIRENSVPKSAFLGENDFGKGTYEGPCPPVGRHRYFFYLYALDTVIDLDEGIAREELEEAMEGHILDLAIPLVGVFEK